LEGFFSLGYEPGLMATLAMLALGWLLLMVRKQGDKPGSNAGRNKCSWRNFSNKVISNNQRKGGVFYG
jgi:hypothetical protein